MPLSSSIKLSVVASLSAALDLVTASAPLALDAGLSLDTGTGAGQADRVFSDERTLSASANEDLDLSGVLTDALGAVITLARVKAIIVIASAGNTNNVIVGAAASNGFAGPFGATTHTVQVRPGGFYAVACSDATGWPVTAGTGDLLRVANAAGGTPVTYRIIIIGCSA
jgi:hypothetical protein